YQRRRPPDGRRTRRTLWGYRRRRLGSRRRTPPRRHLRVRGFPRRTGVYLRGGRTRRGGVAPSRPPPLVGRGRRGDVDAQDRWVVRDGFRHGGADGPYLRGAHGRRMSARPATATATTTPSSSVSASRSASDSGAGRVMYSNRTSEPSSQYRSVSRSATSSSPTAPKTGRSDRPFTQ